MKEKNQKGRVPSRSSARPAEKKQVKQEKPTKGTKNTKKVVKSSHPTPTKAQKTPKKQTKKPHSQESAPRIEGKVRVMMLGGLQEIGKNLGVIEYNDEILLVDCGVAFPDEEMPGVDLVLPDITYLKKNAAKIRGLAVTHGHEDHIGGIPYLLAEVDVSVYGTRLSLGILTNKLKEHRLENKPRLHTVEAGETVRLGAFRVEFIHVNHSIADACCLAIHTPAGVIFHTGDYKLDVSPIDGQMMDVTRLGQLGNEGVLLMMGESTNAERPGFTPSERKVGGSLEQIFSRYKDNRLVIATFSSNVHRVQQIIDASVRHRRKVAVLGRSMVTVVGAAVDLGYMSVPEGTLIDVSELRRFKPSEVTLITTGSQGEPMSALYRMAFDDHDKVRLSTEDVVVLSASPIPGNEKLVGKVVNALTHSGVKIVNNADLDVHVSGHACQEELKFMLSLIRPRYFMPIHGEERHLHAHKEIAEFMGIPADRIFISENGKPLEIDQRGARFGAPVPAGKILVDGSGVGDVGNIVLRDRKLLAEDGIIVVVATVDLTDKLLMSGPDIVSRGFVYMRESEELMETVRRVARNSLEKSLEKPRPDFVNMKNDLRDELSRVIFSKTKRRPVILPVLMSL